MNKSDLVSIRSYGPNDKNFIYASWLRGLYYGDSWYSEVNKKAFMDNYHRIIDFLLSRPDTRVSVACLKEDPEVILGYSVYDKNTLCWVFIKKSWRNIGLAKDLVPSNITCANHATKVGLTIIRKKGWDFNPFAT